MTYAGIGLVELICLILQLLLEVVDALLIAAVGARPGRGRPGLHPPVRTLGLQ